MLALFCLDMLITLLLQKAVLDATIPAAADSHDVGRMKWICSAESLSLPADHEHLNPISAVGALLHMPSRNTIPLSNQKQSSVISQSHINGAAFHFEQDSACCSALV